MTGNTPITPGISPIMIIYNVPVSGRCLQIILGTLQHQPGQGGTSLASVGIRDRNSQTLYLFIVLQDGEIFKIGSAKTNISEIFVPFRLYEAEAPFRERRRSVCHCPKSLNPQE